MVILMCLLLLQFLHLVVHLQETKLHPISPGGLYDGLCYLVKRLFCSVLFASVLFCSVLFCSVLFCALLFFSVFVLFFVLFYVIFLFNSD